MDMVLSFNLIILSYSIIVHGSCPSTLQSWNDRKRNRHCEKENEFYHCLKDENHTFIESCLVKKWIQAAHCPKYSSKANEIDAEECKSSYGKCPTSEFWSYDAYTYTACLNELNSWRKDEKSKNKDGSDDDDENNDNRVVFIVIGIVIGIVVIVAVVMIVTFIKRRNKNKEQSKRDAEETDLSLLRHGPDTNPNTTTRSDEYNTDIGNGAVPCADDKSGNDSATPNAKAKRVPKKSSPHKSLTPRERIDALMNEYLNEEGSSLLLIGDDIEENVKFELRKREENFEVVRCVDDWWTIPNEKKYALILCFLSEGNIASSIRCLESKKEEMLSDIKNRGLHVVTLIGKDVFEKNKEDLEYFGLFNGVDPVYI